MQRRSGSAGGGGRAWRAAAPARAVVAASCLAGMVLGGVVLGGMALGGSGPALAQDGTADPTGAPEGEVPESVPGEEVCALADQRLVEVSGLVAVDDQYIVANDGQAFGFEDRQGIFFLDQGCQVVDEQFYPTNPLDPEALEYDPDSNVLWVGDIGDNASGVTGGGGEEPRITTALWRLDLGGDRTPVIHRFVYPDGQMRDAEALLLDGDGVPIIVTKEAGTAGLYKPTELVTNNPAEQAVQLELLGELSLPDTETENPLGPPGRQVITGGAVSPDRSAVVLRTYADAFEFDVADGDIAAAITEGEPRITPLPDEPLGEAITYTPDGARFLTTSEVPEQQPDLIPGLLAYDPTQPAAPSAPAQAQEPAGDSGRSFFGRLQLQDIMNLIAAVGVLGLILVAIGVVGIVRSRRRAGEVDPGGPGGEDAPVTGRVSLGPSAASGAAGATAAGSPEPGWEPGVEGAHQSGVYSSNAASGYSGTEYGGTEYGGTEYGGGEYGGTEYGGTEYGGTEYGGGEYGGTEYGGTEYGGTEYGGDGYRGTEYGGGADYARGDYEGREYRAGGYGGRAYGGGERGAAYPDQPYDQEWADGGAGGADYYSDDPDYPYEFRGREPGRW